MIKQLLIYTLMFFTSVSTFAIDDEILNTLDHELKREFEALQTADNNLYFLDYRVEIITHNYMSASFGYLTHKNSNEIAYCTITMRYGNNEFDNTHLIKGENQKPYNKAFIFPLHSADAMRQQLWRHVSDLFEQVKGDYTQLKNKMKAEDKTEQKDFTEEPISSFFEPKSEYTFSEADQTIWQKRLEKYSLPFKEDDNITKGSASLNFNIKRTYYLNSEGTRIVQNNITTSFGIDGIIRSEDGNDTPYYKTFIAQTPDKLPTDDVLMTTSVEVKDMLLKLNAAPVADPYAGPVIMAPMAAGVFFHEIFGHRLEGHRLKDENVSNSFKAMVDDEVLPKSLNVYFDPTIQFYSDTYLNGYYLYDDEGVKARRVDVVQNGLLKSFLMNRTPAPGFPNTNGHGRAAPGRSTVARQSNMFIETSKPLSDDKLRSMLIKDCKKLKKEYGYYVKSVAGGFTNLSKYSPNAFNVTPTEVYRIYVDGRPDELVRGVNFIGTPLAMFSEITAAGNTSDIFNGVCGAESGGVPVATVSPALYIKKVETQKKVLKFAQPIILPAPDSDNQ